MMDRRGTLKSLLGGAVAAWLPRVAEGSRFDERLLLNARYEPLGRLSAGTPEGERVRGVTVDGKPVKHCFAADDVEGWAKCFVESKVHPGHMRCTLDGRGSATIKRVPLTEEHRGVVRYILKEEA